MKRLLLFIFITTVFCSCSKYGNVKLNYPTAPQVSLPDNVHRIAVVNRSLFKKDNKNSVIESIITGEIAGSDKKASDECLRGVQDRVKDSRQIEIVIPVKAWLYGSGTRELPEMLDWKLVKSICDSTKADALLVLETFDSNSDILAGVVTDQVNAILNGNPPPPPSRQVRMNVLSNWRLYDPVNQKIIDQYQGTDYMTFDVANSAAFMTPPDALPKTAYFAGEEYIERFLPSYYYVRREMYKRGKGKDKKEFLRAFRKSEVANWEGAMEVWKELSKSHRSVNAGRACLDVAVCYEVLGNINEAMVWAKKAYEDYGNKLALEYQKQLRYRLDVEY